jgi:hypothetical protein
LLLLVSAFNFAAVDLQAGMLTGASDPDDSGSGHDCFACCGHIVPTVAIKLDVQFQAISMTDEEEPSIFAAEPVLFFHPPKA